MTSPGPGAPGEDPDPLGTEETGSGYPPVMPAVPPLRFEEAWRAERARAAWLEAVLDALDPGLLVISPSRHRPGCRVSFVNSAGRRLLGCAADRGAAGAGPAGPNVILPTPAEEWLPRQFRRRRPGRHEPLYCQHRGQSLRLRCLGALPEAAGGGWLLEVTTHGPPAPPCSAAELGRRLGLTPRRAEVLHLLLRGEDNQGIAAAMSISLIVAKQHMQGLCRRFGAASRLAAALQALRELRGET